MADSSPLIVLTFFTLIAGVIIVGGSLLYSLRKRDHREAAGRALIGRDESQTQSDKTFDGALPELVALMMVALAIMALLAAGYLFR